MIKHLRFAKSYKVLGLSLLATFMMSPFASAQDGTDDIEGLFNKDEQSTPEAAPSRPANEEPMSSTPSLGPADSNGGSAADGSANGKTAGKNVQIRDVSDLGKLSEFNDIAVIQRRYLPKTGRFEAYIAPSIVLNDAFFINYGISGRIGYSFTERYAVEFLGTLLSTTERSITSDLRDKRGVVTTSLITPKNYLGVDFRWTPVYGKMTWLNNQIVPFDLYFSIGPGLTSTNQGTSEPTLHFGTGQIFAHTKGMAFRWDFSWNMFMASSNANPADTSKNLFNTLYLSLGASFFFPEATYR